MGLTIVVSTARNMSRSQKSIFTQRNGAETSVRNLKGMGSAVAKMHVLFSTTCNFYSDKIITPQDRFCGTLSHIYMYTCIGIYH